MRLECRKDYKGQVECVIQDGNTLLTIGHEGDNDLFLSMDYYDKEEEIDTEEDREKKEIRYDGLFSLKMGIVKTSEPFLYSLFLKLFSDLKTENEKYGLKVHDKVEIYSDETEAMVANVLDIRSTQGLIELVFRNQPSRRGYKKDISTSVHIPISLHRTETTTNIFEKFFSELPDVIKKEKEWNNEVKETGIKGHLLSLRNKFGKKKNGSK